ncbi:caspase family protein [Streptomyces sp. CB03911]|uniref:caspase family protein n=1 Tax=Streptomyces sp. CB03911 TaxID=1804758 RepID=UPI0018FE7BF0|nr:caspase family protein [Streptomyces sp. CB03911]
MIIANDEYTDEGLKQLRSPAQDAVALGDVLREPQVGGFDVEIIRNESAHDAEAHIEDFFVDCGPDDLLLLHFSCHGLKNESGELFFAASNTRPNRLASTAIPADFVHRCIRDSRSRQKVLLLDCCYGGAFTQGSHVRASGDLNVLDSFDGGRADRGRGWAVITASNGMEYAFEGDHLAEEGHQQASVFTSSVVEGLVTGDADRDEDGRISLDELYDYVFDRVRDRNPHQTPSRIVDLQGDLYVARSRRRRVHADPIPHDVREALTDVNVFTRLGAIAELRSRLDSSDLPIALGAFEALSQIAKHDIRMIAQAAERALAEAALTPDQREVDFGVLVQGTPDPSHVVHLLGPPVAHSCVPEASDSWLRAFESDDGVTISLDTSHPGSRHGEIVLTGATGTATIQVNATVTTPRSAARPPLSTTVSESDGPAGPATPPRTSTTPPSDPASGQRQQPARPREPSVPTHPPGDRRPLPASSKQALVLAVAALPLSIVFGVGAIPAVFSLRAVHASNTIMKNSPDDYRGEVLNRTSLALAWVAIVVSAVFLVADIAELVAGY